MSSLGSRRTDPQESHLTNHRTIVDLSHPITDGMVTYPGLPEPAISDHMTRREAEGKYAPGVTFQIGRIEMVGNTGTYLDSPFHRYEEGSDLSDLDLDRLVDVEAIALDLSGRSERAVDIAQVESHDVTGRAVLLHTGWDLRWGTPAYGVDAPYLTAAAARWLVDRSPALVGIDSVNIDDPNDPERPAHSTLLAAGIPIVEHLCHLDRLPSRGFRFTAVPAPVRGFSSFPIRAVAVIQ